MSKSTGILKNLINNKKSSNIDDMDTKMDNTELKESSLDIIGKMIDREHYAGRFEQIKRLIMVGCTLDETASILGCTRWAIYAILKKEGFANFKEAKKAFGKATVPLLKSKAIEMALNGNVPMIKYTLGNLSDWIDGEKETVVETKHTVVLDDKGTFVKSTNSEKSIDDIISGDIDDE